MKALESKDPSILASALALVLVALLWGTSYAVIKDVIDSIPPFTLMLFRFGLSTLLLAAFYGHKLKGVTRQHLRNSVHEQRGSAFHPRCGVRGLPHGGHREAGPGR